MKKLILTLLSATVLLLSPVNIRADAVDRSAAGVEKELALFRSGVAHSENKEYAKAIADFTEALKYGGNQRVVIYNWRGIAYTETGDDVKAIADFTEGLKIDPDSYTYHNNRGWAYLRVGEYYKAQADFASILKQNPNDEGTVKALENVIARCNCKPSEDAAAALARYNALMSGQSANAAASAAEKARTFYDRAIIYFNKREHEKAIADFTEALNLGAPDAAEAYHMRGINYYAVGEYGKAAADWEEALKIDPDNYVYLSNRGATYRRIGEYGKAIADLTALLSHESHGEDDVGVYYNRGMAYLGVKDYAKAIADFKTAKRKGFSGNELDSAMAAAKSARGGTGIPDTRWHDSNRNAQSFTVSTADELAGLAKLVNAGNTFKGRTITLSRDVDISAYESVDDDGIATGGWPPIGRMEGELSYPFSGVFNGNGKKVSGLIVSEYDSRGTLFKIDNAGLFGYIEGGTVKNLGVVDADVLGGNCVGVVAGAVSSGSSIINCYAAGSVRASGDFAGGVAGYVALGSRVSGCYATGSVSGANWVGGIAGMVGAGDDAGGVADKSVIENCAALNPSVSGTNGDDGVGRVVGISRADKAAGLSNNAAFSGMKDSAGKTAWANKGERNKNGKDISSADISNYGTIGNRFTSKNGWSTRAGKLPGFGQAVEMPGHLR